MEKSILDLPVKSVLVKRIGKYLSPKDILNFGFCSKAAKGISDRMLERMKRLYKENNKASGSWNFSHVEKCRNLRVFFVSSENCLTDAVLERIVANNPKLHTVEIVNCRKLTPRGLEALGKLKNLLDLQITDTEWDNEFLMILTAVNQKLTGIRLTFDRKISTEALVAFFKKQFKLRYIMLKSQEERNMSPILRAIHQNCFFVLFLIFKVPNNMVTRYEAFNIYVKCQSICYIDITNSYTWRGRFAGGKGKEVLLIDEIDSYERLHEAVRRR